VKQETLEGAEGAERELNFIFQAEGRAETLLISVRGFTAP
jgi:hypothetical protein